MDRVAASDADRFADSLEDWHYHVKNSNYEVRLPSWEMTFLALVLAFLSGPSASGAAAGTVIFWVQ